MAWCGVLTIGAEGYTCSGWSTATSLASRRTTRDINVSVGNFDGGATLGGNIQFLRAPVRPSEYRAPHTSCGRCPHRPSFGLTWQAVGRLAFTSALHATKQATANIRGSSSLSRSALRLPRVNYDVRPPEPCLHIDIATLRPTPGPRPSTITGRTKCFDG